MVPFCPREHGKNLGLAYNAAMSRLQDDDWALFLDHDAMFLTRDWYHQVCDVIAQTPDAGVLGARTNRIGRPSQIPPGVDSENHDIRYHRKLAQELAAAHGTQVSKASGYLSGVVIGISKATWSAAGGFRDGFLGVDDSIQKDVKAKTGKDTYLMMGVYVYHWYRGDGDKSHLRATVNAAGSWRRA